MKQHRVSAALAAACLVLSLALPAGAAAPASEEEAVQVVNALGIMVGDARGEMNLSSPVTRAEFITMAVKTSPGGEQVGQSAVSPFPDVPRDHWAAGYVEAGVSAGLISGYADGTFRPNSRITLAEGATIALGLLGYGPNHFSGAYPTGQLALYRSLKLDRGVSVSGAADRLTRRDAMYLFYNLMTAPTKEGRPYLETLGCSLNAAGELDLVALTNESMEGPVLVRGSWQEEVPFEIQGAQVRLADHIAYINHDIEDALRGGIIFPMDIPLEVSSVLGFTHKARIDTLVRDAIEASLGQPEIRQSPQVREAMLALKDFMFDSVYTNPLAKGEEGKAQDMLRRLFEYYQKDPDRLPDDFQTIRAEEGVDRAVCDYIAGMTDPFAVERYKELFIPVGWTVK